MDPTGENPKKNWDNSEEEDELFQDLTQEFDCKEERGPPHSQKTRKNFTGPPVGCFQERKT